MHYIGIMSGTSVDAVDVALMTIPAVGPGKLRETHRHAIPEELRAAIQELTRHPQAHLDQIGELHARLGKLFAEAAKVLLARSGLRPAEIGAIGSHGQTVRHHPEGDAPFTLQLGCPSTIAELTGITTVADFRSRDIAAGGQGAPLAPGFHAAQFRSAKASRAIINLGGIANVTWLPADSGKPVIGFDTGPGNTLLDQWMLQHRNERFDRDGRWAESGKPCEPLLETMLADPYFAAPPPKSTGREHFHLEWLGQHLARLQGALPPEDIQASLLELTVRSIARALAQFLPKIDEVYLCGGGSHNRALREKLAERLAPAFLYTTESLGLHPDWVEAAAFAWLARQAITGQAGNLPSVTGARRAVILGGIYKALT